MTIICSLAVCKTQEGMCGHEKVMPSVAVFLVAGMGAFLLLG